MKSVAAILGLIAGSLSFGIFLFWYIPLQIGIYFGSKRVMVDRDGNVHRQWGTAVTSQTIMNELKINRVMITCIILSAGLLYYAWS